MIVAKTGTAELDRLNALLSWWGVPNLNDTEHIDGRMKRLQAFASNLQKAYGDEYCRQIEGAFTANQRLVFSLQAFLRCRQPQELIPIEIGIWMTVLERVSQQAAAWTDLTQKVQGCCAALVSGDEAEARQEARATESIDRTTPSEWTGSQACRFADHRPHFSPNDRDNVMAFEPHMSLEVITRETAVGQFGSGWALLVADKRRAENRHGGQCHDAARPGINTAPHRRRLGACLLPRPSEPASRFPQRFPRPIDELGFRRSEPRTRQSWRIE